MSDDGDRKWDVRAARMWVLAMVLNLPVPGFFAYVIYISDGKWPHFGAYGVLFACVTVLGTGFFLAGFRSEIMRRITNGGFLVALSQLLPVLQVMAGAFGFVIWKNISKFLPQTPGVEILEGYTLTFLVGQCLMFASFVLGCLLKSNPLKFLVAPREPYWP